MFIRGLQIKARYHYNLLEWLKPKTLTASNADKDVAQEFSLTVGGNAKKV